jgi:hypothetical protein
VWGDRDGAAVRGPVLRVWQWLHVAAHCKTAVQELVMPASCSMQAPHRMIHSNGEQMLIGYAAHLSLAVVAASANRAGMIRIMTSMQPFQPGS